MIKQSKLIKAKHIDEYCRRNKLTYTALGIKLHIKTLTICMNILRIRRGTSTPLRLKFMKMLKREGIELKDLGENK
jgi:hypothetical protein